MDDLAPHNRHYGVRFIAEREFAAQWVRTIHWYESNELMTDWSVPLVPLQSVSDRSAPVSADTDSQ